MPRLFFFAVIFITADIHAQNHATDFTFVRNAPVNLRQTMQRNARTVFEIINRAYKVRLSPQELRLPVANVTPEGNERIHSIWRFARFYCTETEVTARILQTKNGWQARNIPCFFDADGGAYRDMVIEFTHEGIIYNIYPAMQWGVFPESENTIDPRHIMAIRNFLEEFHDAHMSRDIDKLNNIYDDSFIGKNPMKGFKDLFNRNIFINLRLDSIKTVRHETISGLYGITLQQIWKTENFGDEGWLFLLMDLRNDARPMIWARTWQPLTVPRSRVISVVDFDPR